jgi:Ca2+-binding RTX toxin-like protein
MFTLTGIADSICELFCGESQPKNTPRTKPTRRLGQFDSLEERRVMAGEVYTAGGALNIIGTGGNDHVDVSTNATGTVAIVKFNGQTIQKSTAGLNRIEFRGGNGHDAFYNNTGVRANAYGEAGNDTLMGGAAGDYLVGGADNDYLSGRGGNDTLKGETGHDRLHGGMGNDLIEGGAGHDGMVAGYGYDVMNGGSGADRYIFHKDGGGQMQGVSSEDVQVRFANQNSQWTVQEMETADLAFEKLHYRNINLLRDSDRNRSMLTFHKVAQNNQFAGRNFDQSNGTHFIQIADWNESNAQLNAHAVDTVIHEIGHNWDNENRYWNNFLAISGWTQRVAPGTQNQYYAAENGWAYRRSAHHNNLFASAYARTNPHDDFAVSFAAYFLGNRNNANISAKLNLIHQWIG